MTDLLDAIAEVRSLNDNLIAAAGVELTGAVTDPPAARRYRRVLKHLRHAGRCLEKAVEAFDEDTHGLALLADDYDPEGR